MKTLSLSLAVAALSCAACAPTPAAGPDEPVIHEAGGSHPCPVEAYRGYVGRNRSTLPPKPAGETWRVTCTHCPVTMDYNPSRLNILYDEATGVIREVKCG